MTNKINLYVNSSNKKTDETTTNLKCVIPSGLLPSYGKDYFTMSITSFYCYKTFYQMDSTNNEFNLIIRDTSDNLTQLLFFSFEDCIGNPNVYNIRDELNTLLNNYCSVTYDKIKNVFLFTRTKAHSTTNHKIFLKIKTCGTFLGFSRDYNNKEIEITEDGIYSYQPINVIYHQQLLINIDGGIPMSINNLDNRNGVFKPSSIFFMKPLDINRHQLIMYDNFDANSSFQDRISQIENLNQINIRITNQDNEEISTLGDWQLTFQFEQHNEDITERLLTQIKEYISYLFIIIGNYLS